MIIGFALFVSGVAYWYMFIVTVASQVERPNETVFFRQIKPVWFVSKTVSFKSSGTRSTLWTGVFGV